MACKQKMQIKTAVRRRGPALRTASLCNSHTNAGEDAAGRARSPTAGHERWRSHWGKWCIYLGSLAGF